MRIEEGGVEGWDFTVIALPENQTGITTLVHFSLRGRCPCGSELLLDNKPPIAGACGCAPSAGVLMWRDECFADWTAKLGKPFNGR